MVHPVTGRAFTGAEETHPLDFELLTDERIEIDTRGEDVAAQIRGTAFTEFEFGAQLGEHFGGEEGDLTFVVFLVVEKTIAADAAVCDTLNLIDFESRVFPGGLAVVAKIVVARRNEEAAQLHCRQLKKRNPGSATAEGKKPRRQYARHEAGAVANAAYRPG